MTKVAIGGTNGLIDQLLTLVGSKATANVADQERKDALNAINAGLKLVGASDALLYLNRIWSLTYANGASTIIVPNATTNPPALDFGKDFVIEDQNGMPIRYCSGDEFAALTGNTYDAVGGSPAGFMIAIDTDDVLKFFLKPTNGATPLTFTLRGQRVPPEVTDDVASFSLLPETYEITLLLPIAEQYIKQRKHEIDAQMLDQQTQRYLASFYDKFRANKRQATTDSNLERRVGEDQASANLTR